MVEAKANHLPVAVEVALGLCPERPSQVLRARCGARWARKAEEVGRNDTQDAVPPPDGRTAAQEEYDLQEGRAGRARVRLPLRAARPRAGGVSTGRPSSCGSSGAIAGTSTPWRRGCPALEMLEADRAIRQRLCSRVQRFTRAPPASTNFAAPDPPASPGVPALLLQRAHHLIEQQYAGQNRRRRESGRRATGCSAAMVIVTAPTGASHADFRCAPPGGPQGLLRSLRCCCAAGAPRTAAGAQETGSIRRRSSCTTRPHPDPGRPRRRHASDAGVRARESSRWERTRRR